MKMKLYLINCSNLYLAFAALSDAEANTATYFYYCVSDLPNKLTGGLERIADCQDSLHVLAFTNVSGRSVFSRCFKYWNMNRGYILCTIWLLRAINRRSQATAIADSQDFLNN